MIERLNHPLASYLIWFFLTGVTCHAVPMDSAAAKRLPELRQIVGKARAHAPLAASEIEILRGHLRQGDPVLVSLAAWALGQAQRDEESQMQLLREAGQDQVAMPAAFIDIALIRLARISNAEKVVKLKKLAQGENSYARVEAAKALVQLDPVSARELLEPLTQDREFVFRGEAAAALKKMAPTRTVEAGSSAEDEQYELLLSIIEAPESLAKHEISGEIAGRKTASPFLRDVETVQFAWQHGDAVTSDPIEIRWIAADTGGAAPNDTVITTGKSDAGKTEGTFTLSKPTSGFPPGRYRIEIWQAGKMIHSEPFEIEK